MFNIFLLILTLNLNPLKVWAGGKKKKDTQIKYHNIGFDDSGLDFQRDITWDFQFPFQTFAFDEIEYPEELSGIAIFDYDNDGDLDIFVSNGIGSPHSLFQNQLDKTGLQGDATFIDVGASAGFGDTESIDHKGSGVCHGDVNNDGCTDILVTGHIAPSLLYINNCDGTFTYTAGNGIDTQTISRSASCTFGDIDNDGDIDLFIANSGNIDNPILVLRSAFLELGTTSPFQFHEPNELYLNNGDNTFTDISDRVFDTRFSFGDDPATIYDGNDTLTWAATMVDVDQDGFLDIIEINDQFGPINEVLLPRGVNQIWYGQGDGTFISKPFGFIGSWMGIAQGDLNCDGDLDLFVSNFGAYARDVITFGQLSLNYPTQWFFQDDSVNGNFAPDTNDIFNFDFVTPFGWGGVIYDYDNDGDYDILVHGGLDAGSGIIADNPGTLYQNNDGCFQDVERVDALETGVFEIDEECAYILGIPGCTYHTTRIVWGTAIGDLNNDGFYDIVTTSQSVVDLNQTGSAVPGTGFIDGFPIPPPGFSIEGAMLLDAKNDPPGDLDDTAIQFPTYITLTGPPEIQPDFLWLGYQPLPGDLFVEVASADNGNNWIKITAKGSKDLCLVEGNVNRDGIGAILNVDKMTQAITGGESMISSHSFEKIFGLGKKNRADLTIKWPRAGSEGGYNVNKLNNIKKGSILTIYEIPCDFETRNADKKTRKEYEWCVERSLDALYFEKLISKKLKRNFEKSMLVY